MDKEMTMLKTLRHVRHDYLNYLQLIKGNIQINNIARAEEIIDEISLRYSNEAKLTNLKMPNLASLIITYNWNSPSFKLLYEVKGKLNFNLTDEEITNWLESFFASLGSAIDQYYNNELTITLVAENDKQLIKCNFSGKVIELSEIEKFLSKAEKEDLIERVDLNDNELFTLNFRF